MKRKVFTRVLVVLLLVAMLLPMLPLIARAVPLEDALSANSIQLIPVDLDAIIEGDADSIVRELYPSGMRLPTMFADFLDFIPYSGNIVQGSVASALREEYPGANGYFTYAEYRAMERFLSTAALLQTGTNSLVSTALEELMLGETWFYSGTSPLLVDSTRFSNAIKVYKNFYLAIVEMDGSEIETLPEWKAFTTMIQDRFYLTAGTEFLPSDVESGGNPQLTVGISYSEYLSQLPAMWDYFGFKLNLGAVPEPTDDGQEDVPEPPPAGEEVSTPEVTVPSNPNNKYIYSDVQIPKKNITVDEETGYILVDGKEVRFPTDEVAEDKRSTTVVQAITPPEDLVLDAPLVKQYGLRDFLTTIALILVMCAVLATWIIHTIRQHQDPLKRWKM